MFCVVLLLFLFKEKKITICGDVSQKVEKLGKVEYIQPPSNHRTEFVEYLLFCVKHVVLCTVHTTQNILYLS